LIRRLDNRPAGNYICIVMQLWNMEDNLKDETIPSAGEGLERLLSPPLFKAMCDPNRIAILLFLSKRCAPLTVGEIAESLPVDVSVVSRHLSILRDAEILRVRKQGKQVRYSINSRKLIMTLRAIADAFEACCPDECPPDGG